MAAPGSQLGEVMPGCQHPGGSSRSLLKLVNSSLGAGTLPKRKPEPGGQTPLLSWGGEDTKPRFLSGAAPLHLSITSPEQESWANFIRKGQAKESSFFSPPPCHLRLSPGDNSRPPSLVPGELYSLLI